MSAPERVALADAIDEAIRLAVAAIENNAWHCADAHADRAFRYFARLGDRSRWPL